MTCPEGGPPSEKIKDAYKKIRYNLLIIKKELSIDYYLVTML